jgi:hypothetical protein
MNTLNFIWGAFLILLSSVAYFGQLITTFWPELAAKLGVAEAENEVDGTFYADIRGEAIWDSLTLWTLPLAGLLLILNSSLWPYLGLVGGGMYLYFAGRGIVTRRLMHRNNIQIGKPETLKVAYSFLTLWGLAAVITIFMAMAALPLS